MRTRIRARLEAEYRKQRRGLETPPVATFELGISLSPV
jgi:hypothetical protein